jgi:DnaJ like chaperone protein
LVLAWIAVSDGTISPEEEESLRKVGSPHNSPSEVEAIIGMARHGRSSDLQLACEFLQHIPNEHRSLFLQMAIGMSLEDGYLVTTENYILRFLADLSGLGEDGLNDVFQEMTEQPFPLPSDPSRIEWWQARETRSQQRPENHQTENQAAEIGMGNADLQRVRNLSVLGLDENATADDIRSAYRRMAKIHHPDRFVSLGAEAVEAAELTMRRINAAYETLVRA